MDCKRLPLQSQQYFTMVRKILFAVIILGLLSLTTLSFCEDRLVIKDSGGNSTFNVTDAGVITAMKSSLGNGVTAGNATRTFNVVSPAAVARFWRIHDSFPPGFDLIHSLPGSPSVARSSFHVFGGPYSGSPNVFGIMDRTNGDITRLTIGPTGNVAIGMDTTLASHLIQLDGGAYCDGGAWVTGSSRELKKNIESISYSEALQTVMQLDPVSYNYKKTPAEKHIGFIAEDVPDMVAVNSRKGLETMDFVAVLTKVVQEQQKAIAHLQLELEALKNNNVASR